MKTIRRFRYKSLQVTITFGELGTLKDGELTTDTYWSAHVGIISRPLQFTGTIDDDPDDVANRVMRWIDNGFRENEQTRRTP